MKPLVIVPPLLNSACPWATTEEHLKDLYLCPYTGAVTTRTSLLTGFPHNSQVHQYSFFDPSSQHATGQNQRPTINETSSLNTLGYSPIVLADYLGYIKNISNAEKEKHRANQGDTDSAPIKSSHKSGKPFIISVSGSTDEVAHCYKLIHDCQHEVHMPLAMEINLSCPNIPNKPPPAYSGERLLEYLLALKVLLASHMQEAESCEKKTEIIPIGIKTPPYTYSDQFSTLVEALLRSANEEPAALPCPITFITATNTLGSSLLLTPEFPKEPETKHTFSHTLNSSNGTGIGGMAGSSLHPLALGNVYTLRSLLSQHKQLDGIIIIGVGGVSDATGFARMRAVGAAAVAVASGLGRKGLDIFKEISAQPEI